jgi:hypothetical protein
VIVDPEVVYDLVRQNRADELIGATESQQVEFKGVPYHLASDAQKYELAKDVSALANAEGGIIVLGVQTERSEHLHRDVAAEINPFRRSLFAEEQYQDIIISWIFPRPEHVTVQWFAPPSSSDGIGVIRVARQPLNRGPYVLVRVLDEKGRRWGAVVGYYRRMDARALPITGQEIQSLMRDGVLFRGRLFGASRNTDTPSDKGGLPEERIKEAIDAAGLADAPVYALSAFPDPRLNLTAMFESKANDLNQAISNPTKLREMGFNLNMLPETEIIRGELRRSAVEGYGALDVWADGCLVFSARGNEEYLSWAGESEESVTINPIALVESVYLFCLFSSSIYELLDTERPKVVYYELRLIELDHGGKPVFLYPGPARHPRRRSGKRKAPSPSATFGVRSDFGEASAGKVAYEALAKVYRWFGFTDDAIPYTCGPPSDRVICPDAIRDAPSDPIYRP